MSISTTEKPEDKREKLKKLRDYHQPVFDRLGVPNAIFFGKLAYRPSGMEEIHISFFESEINKGEDVYVEFTNRDLVPEDPERTLYKWVNNPHYAEEYAVTEPSVKTGHVRYLVPVSELVVMSTKTEPGVQKELFEELPDADADPLISMLTIRDFAAIMWKAPVSTKKWLNELIKQQK